MDHVAFIKDKGLIDLVDTLSLETMKNRVLIAKVKKKTYNTKKTRNPNKFTILPNAMGRRKDSQRKWSIMSDESKGSQPSDKLPYNSHASLFDKALNGMSSKSSYYIFLISQKPLNAVDEEYFAIDHEVMKKADLKPEVQFNRILFYTYKSLGDSSEPKKHLSIEQICSVQVLIYKKKAYHLKIKLENGKYYFFMFQQAVETVVWLDGLRTAVKIQEEITRSKFGLLKYNIRIVYKLQEQNKKKDLNDIMDSIIHDLDAGLAADVFLERFKASITEVNFFCDAFFSYKPFVLGVFQLLISSVHGKIRGILMDFWNRNYLEMIAGEILTFGRQIHEYREMLRSWGVVDKKLMDCNKPVIATFCNRLFDSSKEIMFNVIDEAMYKFQIENKIYRNRSIKILESHINICFENYSQMPTLETAYQLIDMIMMIITIVEMNLITQVQNPKKNLDFEVLASLLNNDFETLIHKFMKKIHKKTRSEISLQDIRKIINYPYLQRNNIKMSHVCLVALNGQISLEVNELFAAQNKPFDKFNLRKFLDKINFQFSRIFLGLVNVHEKFDILDKICLRILKLYFEHFLRFCRHMRHSNMAALLDKVSRDRQTLLNYFRPFIDNDLDCHIDILLVLHGLLEAMQCERIRVSMIKLIAFFGAEYGRPEHVRNMVRSKVYLSGAQADELVEDFEQIYERHVKDSGRLPRIFEFIKNFNPMALKFIKIMKKRMKRRSDKTVKMRSSTLNFRPQNVELELARFSADAIYAFSSECVMVKFPKDLDDFEIEEHLSTYLQKKKK